MLQVRVPIPRLVSAGEVFFDAGSAGVLRALDAGRVAVVCSQSFSRQPEILERVTKPLQHLNSRLFQFTGEPTLQTIKPLVEGFFEFKPDWIIAVGGGSVIDACKMAWLFYEHPDLEIERALIPGAIGALRGKARFAVLPTTAGTGSEVSSSALFHDEKEDRKKFFISHHFLPDLVILDPLLMAGLSSKQILASALDALAHSLEGVMNKAKHGFLDAQAEAAVSLILQNLELAQDSKNIEARSSLMKAAMMAGWVQNSKIPGVGHAIGHQLSAVGIGHGAAVGLVLPDAIRFNSADQAVMNRMNDLSKRMGFGSAVDLASKIESLPMKFGISNRLRDWADAKIEVKLDNAFLRKVADGALKDICARHNPVPLKESDVISILEKRW